jgi:RNA polymerase sigma-70 factor (ECF subfamily)
MPGGIVIMVQSSDETKLQKADAEPASGQARPSAVEPDPLVDHGRAYFAALFHKYRSSLFRYLSGLVSSPEDAAELVQESYVRLLQHDDVARLEAVSRTYLFQIATNLARDHFRRRTSRHSAAHFGLEEFEIADEQAGPERKVAWDQTIGSIKQGIKELSPMTRRIFLLSRFRGKTYPQIAALLGISTRTVERKMSEAMEILAARLGERP